MSRDELHMRRALVLARKGYGRTSPNPMVGAVVVKSGRVLGEGWHRRAGAAHAEVEAINAAGDCRGATLYVTLEPCSTQGRTPPCVDAILSAGIRRVVAATVDPNPVHAGKAFRRLRRNGVKVAKGILAAEAVELNTAFNHWIVHGTPLVTVKAAMTLDGRIATASGESKWITGPAARREGHRLRKGNDAILVGINTVLADDPALIVKGKLKARPLRRIILDSSARIPLKSRVLNDDLAAATTVVVTKKAPKRRVKALGERALVAPARKGQVDLRWLLQQLGREEVSSLLVEGGGEVNASFLEAGLAQRVAFFYAPKIIGGESARRAVAGRGVRSLGEVMRLDDAQWQRVGVDLMLTARVVAA